MVLSVGEVLQTRCLDQTNKVSRPLPWGGQSWWDDTFSKSRVRPREQVKVGTVTLAVNSRSIARVGPFQLLGWEGLGLSTHLVSLAPEKAGGAGRQHWGLGKGARGLLQGLALRAWRWAARGWL